MHGLCYGIQCKHKEWIFNHQKLPAYKDSLSHIYTEGNRDQMHKSINKFDRTAQWTVLHWYCKVSYEFKNRFTLNIFTWKQINLHFLCNLMNFNFRVLFQCAYFSFFFFCSKITLYAVYRTKLTFLLKLKFVFKINVRNVYMVYLSRYWKEIENFLLIWNEKKKCKINSEIFFYLKFSMQGILVLFIWWLQHFF